MEEADDEPLRFLASNYRFAWNSEVRALFDALDPARFRESDENPAALLAEGVSLPERLAPRAHRLAAELRAYLDSRSTWSDSSAGHTLRGRPIAYFSMEFGLHESLRIYSGGLGVLAGDHLKSASDLGVPLVGIGLFYHRGYFTQRIDATGWQRDEYPESDPTRLPMELARQEDGSVLHVTVETRGAPIVARVWELAIGRVRLLLLDTDFDANPPAIRSVSHHLYGGDEEMRIRQELVVGVGGVRALYALGIHPAAFHLNEGHCAFGAMELVRRKIVEEGYDFETACKTVADLTVFTTHTPVPAGHDRFPASLVEANCGPLRDAIGVDQKTFLSLGRVRPHDDDERFCMTVLALKLSTRANGVSSLHGRVTRRMWHELFPQVREHEVPIGHITNGVHLPTWLAPRMRALFDKYLPPGWIRRHHLAEVWGAIESIPEAELWDVHLELKRALIDRTNALVREMGVRHGNKALAESEFDQRHLLIGFARRFATYKRATLVLSDLDRLDQMVNDPEMPVRFVFAGKAHPKDDGGKKLMQRIWEVGKDPRFAGKIVFLDGYDLALARCLVQGVDVWLNNPRRPLEASGTSGQKVIMNGGLHCSILDGWWAEAWDGENGFALGHGETHADSAIQDARDELELIRVLTEEVIPLYYQRDEGSVPRDWVRTMKHSLRTLAWRFSADRMVIDYVERAYLPAAGVAPI
jgi:starch phosphorylase